MSLAMLACRVFEFDASSLGPGASKLPLISVSASVSHIILSSIVL